MDDVEPLLRRVDLTHLAHLGLMNAAFTDNICRALTESSIAPQLHELDLSLGTMTDAGAEALARARAFPKVTRLDGSRNYVSDDGIALLREVFPEVIAEDQREADDDEDNRYPSVGE